LADSVRTGLSNVAVVMTRSLSKFEAVLWGRPGGPGNARVA